jgi:branched-chain amino acid transport system ATP-binding protein
MLKIRNLEVFYGNIRSLKSVSIFVDSAEIVTIIGSNGAGKTTLLKAVSGTAPSVRGRIYFEGVDITHYPTSRRVEMKISHVPEGRHVFPTLSVKDNLILGGFTRLRKGLKKEVADAYKHVVELFPVLKTREKQQGGTLSGGEQQMLTMGRALMADPKLLLLDEPSMGLAPIVKELIFDTLQKLRQSSLTMLLVEQEAEAALSIADRGYVLQNGEIVLEDTGERLLNNPQIKEAYLGIAYEKRG